MRFGFYLDLQNVDYNFKEELTKHRRIGENHQEKHSCLILESLEGHNDFSQEIDAEILIQRWFPSIDADVFISHSHGDIDLIMSLSGWLKQKCGLTPFVDFSSWKYITTLIEKIQNKNGNMNEADVLLHGHIMLATSLMRMIAKCKCILFVKTPNSIHQSTSLNRSESIHSPWIFLEMVMSEILLSQRPNVISKETLTESLDKIIIKYPRTIDHLTRLSASNIKDWANNLNKNKNMNAEEKFALLQEIIGQKPRRAGIDLSEVVKNVRNSREY